MDEVICDFEKAFGCDFGKRIMSQKEIRSIVKYNQEHRQVQKVTRGAPQSYHLRAERERSQRTSRWPKVGQQFIEEGVFLHMESKRGL